ncbi:MAG: DUF5658 family protein [Chloroflexi bacterium]|nr:DUF5658 family protein [Chloroflexota bacterium]
MTSDLWSSAATFKRGVAVKASFVALNHLDLVLTVVAVSLGLTELNHWMRVLLATPLLLVGIKGVLPVFIGWLVPGKCLLPAVLLLSVVVAWDIGELVVFLH